MARTNLLERATRATVFALTCAALPATAAHAQTLLISNLDQAQAGYTIFNTTSDRYAQEFTPTSAVSSFLSAQLILNQQEASANPDTVHLYVYSSSPYTVNGLSAGGYMPSTTIVGDLGTATVTGTAAATYTFSSSSSVSLTGNQPYWLVLTDNLSNVGWAYTTSTTTTGSGATVDPDSTTAASPDAGANWSVQGNDQGLQLFSLSTVSAVMPEPGSLPLVLLGAGGLALVSLRRRRTASAKSSLIVFRTTAQK